MAEGTPLPPLHPFLKLYKSADVQGEPSWTIHNPVSNAYYKVAWPEFECLARFSRAETAEQLKSLVEAETPLTIDIGEIKELTKFLLKNGLTDTKFIMTPLQENKVPVWKQILQRYLYFTIPLFRPEEFLKKTLPLFNFLSSGPVLLSMLLVGVWGLFMTLQRADEFLSSFVNFLSWEGVVLGLVVLCFVKIIHEFAHAYTAVKYGTSVPHMGIAVIVLYPVLYTETTGSWKLESAKSRFRIGGAGIAAELCLAAWFLVFWNMSPAGSMMQSVCFSVVAVSLISSLLINLNPLMRFDGYYMLSDIIGIENLQNRACDFARWKLRETLFALNQEKPEYLPYDKEKFLILFGTLLLVYRFFLFFGISLLVYHLFMKPLGLMLMMVELAWFIGLPVWGEMKIWWKLRSHIISRKRSGLIGVYLLIIAGFAFIPWHGTVSFPAVMHSAQSFELFPYASSRIEKILVTEGQTVKQGDILLEFSSIDLEKRIALATQKVRALENMRRHSLMKKDAVPANTSDVEAELEKTELELHSLLKQKDRLVVTAPFDGNVRDFNPDLRAGQNVSRTNMILRVVDQANISVTGYADEEDIRRMQAGNRAEFIPDSAPLTAYPLKLEHISAAAAGSIAWPELVAAYHGPVPAEFNQRDEQFVPLRSVYSINLVPVSLTQFEHRMVQVGWVQAEASVSSPFMGFFRQLAGLFRREIGLN